MLDVAITYALTDCGLDVSTTARHAGSAALPYAAGRHPYLLSPTTVNDCTLTLTAATYLETDDRGLPVASERAAGSPYDFRVSRRMAGTELDHAFTDLDRDREGRTWVRLTSPDDVTTALWVDDTYPYIELSTGDAPPDPARRRRSLGVEPMTAPPNAFGDSVGVTRLEPGAITMSRWGLTVHVNVDNEAGRGPQPA
jgi:aldose 1-epimerase